MRHIIAYRVSDGPVEMVTDDEGNVFEFGSKAEADGYVMGNELFASGQAGYEIIRLEI
jgi:hypothetical protein